jgi:hypothetical protein
MERICHTIEQLDEVANLKRTKAYEEIKTGRLASFKRGRTRLVSHEALLRYQAQLETESQRDGTVS